MPVFKDNKTLKADARESLLGNLTTAVLSIFICMMASSVLAELIAGFDTGSILLSLILTTVMFLVISICGNMLGIGLSYIFLRLQYQKGAKVGDLFTAFRGSSDAAVIVSTFLAALRLLCFLPLGILLSVLSAEGRSAYRIPLLLLFMAGYAAAFVIRIRYSMLPYLLLDFPQLLPKEHIRGGVKLIRGHKMRLFRLYLSFLPLQLLTVLSFGIAGLWVSSYERAAEAAFYKDLIENTFT